MATKAEGSLSCRYESAVFQAPAAPAVLRFSMYTVLMPGMSCMTSLLERRTSGCESSTTINRSGGRVCFMTDGSDLSASSCGRLQVATTAAIRGIM